MPAQHTGDELTKPTREPTSEKRDEPSGNDAEEHGDVDEDEDNKLRNRHDESYRTGEPISREGRRIEHPQVQRHVGGGTGGRVHERSSLSSFRFSVGKGVRHGRDG